MAGRDVHLAFFRADTRKLISKPLVMTNTDPAAACAKALGAAKKLAAKKNFSVRVYVDQERWVIVHPDGSHENLRGEGDALAVT